MSRRRGFTLIELMIVASIIGILAMIALPKFAQMVRKSKEASTLGKLGTLRSAMSIYYSNTEGVLAATIDTLTIDGVYLDQIPIPWTFEHSEQNTPLDR